MERAVKAMQPPCVILQSPSGSRGVWPAYHCEKVEQVIPPEVGLRQDTGQDSEQNRKPNEANEDGENRRDAVVLPDWIIAKQGRNVLRRCIGH